MPLREASAVAARIGAQPLLNELELLAERARLDPTPPEADPHHATQGLEEPLGLTPREAEVLTLVARGLTNREIAATLVISVKTAGVHVSHILRKLDVPNRVEPPQSPTASSRHKADSASSSPDTRPGQGFRQAIETTTNDELGRHPSQSVRYALSEGSSLSSATTTRDGSCLVWQRARGHKTDTSETTHPTSLDVARGHRSGVFAGEIASPMIACALP